MKFSNATVGLMAGLLALPVVPAGLFGQQANRAAGAAGQESAAPSAPNRQLRRTGGFAVARPPRNPNAPHGSPAQFPQRSRFASRARPRTRQGRQSRARSSSFIR